ncbi:MAG: hypothetical protein BWY75_00270 [bacterium ADurb.Bin425]|nr:MAG: hypothetical protein BWY75_00270 [bacterium ADurb.Bin425]
MYFLAIFITSLPKLENRIRVKNKGKHPEKEAAIEAITVTLLAKDLLGLYPITNVRRA